VPWKVSPNDNECPVSEPWGVRKETDDALEGCHASRKEALDQVAALYASEADAEHASAYVSFAAGNINLKPTEEMASNAARGLELRRKYNRGGTSVGVARARDISNRKQLSHSTVKRMVSYFARHEVDKDSPNWPTDKNGRPSNGYIAWLLWGGDSGRAWANARSKQIDRQK